MPVPVFTWVPSPSYSDDHELRVLVTNFGDGYEQTVGDGINIDLQTITFPFKSRSTSERNAIIAFLRARNGTEAFQFTPHGSAVARLWRCSRYGSTPVDDNNWDVWAELREVTA